MINCICIKVAYVCCSTISRFTVQGRAFFTMLYRILRDLSAVLVKRLNVLVWMVIFSASKPVRKLSWILMGPFGLSISVGNPTFPAKESSTVAAPTVRKSWNWDGEKWKENDLFVFFHFFLAQVLQVSKAWGPFRARLDEPVFGRYSSRREVPTCPGPSLRQMSRCSAN